MDLQPQLKTTASISRKQQFKHSDNDIEIINFVDIVNRFNARVNQQQSQQKPASILQLSAFVTPIPKHQNDSGDIVILPKQEAKHNKTNANDYQYRIAKYPTFTTMREELFEDQKFSMQSIERMFHQEEFEKYNFQIATQNYQLIRDLFDSNYAINLVGSYDFSIFVEQLAKCHGEHLHANVSQSSESSNYQEDVEILYLLPKLGLKQQIDDYFKTRGEQQAFDQSLILVFKEPKLRQEQLEYIQQLLNQSAQIIITTKTHLQVQLPLVPLNIETLYYEYNPVRVERTFGKVAQNTTLSRFELFRGILQHQLSNIKFQFYMASFLELVRDKLETLSSVVGKEQTVTKEDLSKRLSENLQQSLKGGYVDQVKKLLLVRGQQDLIMEAAHRAQTAKGSVVVLDLISEGYGLYEVTKEEVLHLLEICYSVLHAKKVGH